MTTPDQPDRVEHRMECTYEVTATPEQVWEAIATADGIAAWMVPTRLDPQIGGEVSFDLGGFLIEAASGGSCLIRIVTSAYGSGADWENEFFAEMMADTGPILDNLVTHFQQGDPAMRTLSSLNN